MNLRPYQERAISALRESYGRGKRAPCLVIPTGGGKTVIASAIIRSAVARNRRVLFLAHRQELISQSVAKLEAAGVSDLRVIQAAADLGNRKAPVAVASIPTLTNWDVKPEADLVVFDECHHTVAKTWADIAGNYRSALLLGMTATPQRADRKPLGDVFDDLVVGSSVSELVDIDHLVPCRIWSPPAGVLENGQLAVSPAHAYLEHGKGERAVIFCADRKHAALVAEEMNAAGIPTGVVHGQLGNKERASTLERLRTGELRAVANVYVLTEGWDEPSVSVCILAKKPGAVSTYLQMIGRVLRPAPGKTEARLLDLAGASLEHGPPEMERVYSLDGEGISKVNRENIRQCLACGAVFKAGPRACPMCGEMPGGKPFDPPRAVGVGLVERSGEVVDQLLVNLRAVARRARRDEAWVGKAYQAIRRVG